MHAIPKIIHLAWKDKNLLESDHAMITTGVKRLKDLNPTWKISISDDREIDTYLSRMLGPRDYQMIQSLHIVEKSDLWRLFKIYLEGGLYVDIDRFCNVDLDHVIPDGIRCILPTCLDSDFSQDIMLSEPQNPLHYQAIMMVLQRRRAGQTGTYWLGPQTYMHAVTQSLLGTIINSNPGAGIFEQIRRQIDSIPGFMTYRENPPYQTLIYREPIGAGAGTEEWISLKKDFYARSNIRHWTNTW